MRLPRFADQTVVAVRRSPADRYGDRSADTRTQVGRCSVQPATASESTQAATRTDTTYRLFGPRNDALVALRSFDAIEVAGGRVFEVNGLPAVWPDHVEVALREVEG